MTEATEFYNYIQETNPDLIVGWKQQFECPCCLETVSSFGSSVCTNGHRSSCKDCSLRMFANNDFLCTICRATDALYIPTDLKLAVDVHKKELEEKNRQYNQLRNESQALYAQCRELLENQIELTRELTELRNNSNQQPFAMPTIMKFRDEHNQSEITFRCTVSSNQRDGYFDNGSSNVWWTDGMGGTGQMNITFRKSVSWFSKGTGRRFVIKRSGGRNQLPRFIHLKWIE